MRSKMFLMILLAGSAMSAFSQETARERIARREAAANAIGSVTIATPQAGEGGEEELRNLKWSRVIYRYLDLSRDANAPLYYPVTPEEGRMNFFTLIFRLLQKEAIAAYEYLDGKESFTEAYRIDLKQFLDRFGIYYETVNDNLTVNDADIPGNEVQGYFVKELYYFDTVNSHFGVKVVAVCPVMHRQGDYEATTTRYPLFWIPYDMLSPYAKQIPVMTSSLNNSMSGTIDDLFRKQSYQGEIYKAANPQNLTIAQYTSGAEEMKAEQERIEKELRDFEQNLWKEEAPPPLPGPQKNRRSKKVRKSSASETSGAPTVTMRDRRL